MKMKSEIKEDRAFNRLGLLGLKNLRDRIEDRGELLLKERKQHIGQVPRMILLTSHDVLSPTQRSVLYTLRQAVVAYDLEDTPSAARARNLARRELKKQKRLQAKLLG